ncbi:DsbA family oxidoreductase [Nocardiopsis dassonvillei]|uniref:DsbA family oxidoreductase n=1 Tax=Nocardiopsis dassonvillei TaxID=2014 RepID=UPI00366B0DCC
MTVSELPAENREHVARPEPGVVTVWSDIGCPWATLALDTLHARARERGMDLAIDHRAFPLELFNRIPTPKQIVDSEVVAIAAVLPHLGWRLWPGPESTYPVTTLPALEAVQAAKSPQVGGLAASDELDTALRRALYAEGRCVSIHPVILDIARECPRVDADALAEELALGRGRAEVYEHWRTARGPHVQGSPHLFAAGWAEHNPGVRYHWTAPPPEGGFPRLEEYDPSWAEGLLDAVRKKE